MEGTLRIAVWAGNSIGGTEKAATLFAIGLARRGHEVFFLSISGPRDADLAGAQVQRLDQPQNAQALASWLQEERIDALHQHVPGYPLPSPIYEALALLGAKRPRLIETNIFGVMEDREGDKWVDMRCFISCSSGYQAFERLNLPFTAANMTRKTVLFFPLPPIDPLAQGDESRRIVRRELGVAEDEILIVRLGRPSVKKWNRNEVEVFQQARREDPRLRLLLMEPSPAIWSEVESGRWGEGIILQRATSDFARLTAICHAGDFMLHMSDFGESFGYALAEAMQQGLPIVTQSTPWCDNAQVELVEHGTTGFVCTTCRGASRGVLLLAKDAELRRRFGSAARQRIDHISNFQHELDVLEEVLGHVIRRAPLRLVEERNGDWLAFGRSFGEREKRCLERETAGFGLSGWRGAAYGTYRSLRNKAGRWKRKVL